MARVAVSSVSKSFGATPVLHAVDLAVEDGEFLALLGPSGCGKTTLLRLVAGFETPDRGSIAIGDTVVAEPAKAMPPEERNIGMVFQSYALWPHMSVEENVAFALRVRRVPPAERRRRVAEALDIVGLAGFGGRRPQALSGGQRQRVALARCLAMRPAVVLLDEPLANLDVHLREAMQTEFRRFHKELGATFIYVTHDQAEAIALADRVAVMSAGRLEQVADPRALYHQPATETVARFLGRGMVLPARVVGDEEGRVVVAVLGARLRARGAAGIGEERQLCVRPSDLRIAETGIEARVTSVRFQGALSLVTATAAGAIELTVECRGETPAEGTVVHVTADDGWLLPVRP